MLVNETLYDAIIVGAGLAGLALAYRCCEAHWKTLVIEASEQVGGCVHSYRLSDEEEFWFELGAHSSFNSYSEVIALMEGVGLGEELVVKGKQSFQLWDGQRLRSIPSQLHWLNLITSLPRLMTTKKAGRTVADYYGRIVGERNYRDVFGPAFNAVTCQPAAEFPAELLFGRRQRRKDRPRSFTLPGGLLTLLERLAARPGLELVYREPVQSLSWQPQQPVAVTTSAGRYYGRRVALATPVTAAQHLLQAPLPEVAAELDRLEASAIETLAVVLPKEAVTLKPLAGIIARDDNFYSAVARDVVGHPKLRAFTFHFKPNRLDQAGKEATIARCLGVAPGSWRLAVSKVNALPILRLGHQERVATIDQHLKGQPVDLTGNYFTGVSLEDAARRSQQVWQRWSQG